MRVFALSDIHVDYESNARWISSISTADFQDDVLVVAGDVTDTLSLLEWCLTALAIRFRRVLFVPGNHELWVARDGRWKDSLQKFREVAMAVASCGASMQAFQRRGVSIVPIFGWYDYSFGEPSEELKSIWMDYYACRWPDGFLAGDVASYFAALNTTEARDIAGKIITFSHFLPRIDLMPNGTHELLYPVLGAWQLDRQLRLLSSSIHVYGHSHVNRVVEIDGVIYVNNAFGYPSEARVASRRLLCIHPDILSTAE